MDKEPQNTKLETKSENEISKIFEIVSIEKQVSGDLVTTSCEYDNWHAE